MSVKITKNIEGQEITVSKKNPEYGYIRVEQSVVAYAGHFANVKTRSALINGPIEVLEALVEAATVEGSTKVLPGKIVIKESFTAPSEDPTRTLKLSGKDGIPCTKDDQPIFRDTFYTEDVSEQDELIEHDNTEQIKAHNAAQVLSEEALS